jgi:hypothetical protein
MRTMVIEFETLDDGYDTTRAIVFVDDDMEMVVDGRGEFDVINKIAKRFTDRAIAMAMPSERDALEDHIKRLMESQGDSE